MSLKLQEILAAQDLGLQEVPVPEWGGSVYVRRLSASDVIDLGAEQSVAGLNGAGDAEHRKTSMAIAVRAFLCDDAGQALCATVDEARAFLKKAAGPVNRIVTLGLQLNALDNRDLAALSKNSAPSPEGTSPSA